MKKRNALQDAVDEYEAKRLESYEKEYDAVDKEAHRFLIEGQIKEFYEALLLRKELREKIAHAKICTMRTKEVR